MLTLQKLNLSGPSATVRVSTAEATLLRAFAQSPDGRMDLTEVAQCLGVVRGDTQRSNIQVRIVRLRKKLQVAGAEGAVIEAIRNVGYQFFDELSIRKA